MKDKIKGALFGHALGDAIGAPAEFLSKRAIAIRYGQIRGHHSGMFGIPFFLRLSGQGTDDTRFARALANGILKNPEDPFAAIGKEFAKQRWFPVFVGRNLLLDFFFYFGDWEKTSKFVDRILGGKTAGNGALMRCLPAALAYGDFEKMKQATEKQAIMTHWSGLSTESCLIGNAIVWRTINGEPLRKAAISAAAGTRYENPEKKPDTPPNGFCVSTLKWALYHALNAESFEEAIVSAVNEGGDTDSIGAVAGGLAGAEFGFSSIPEGWIKGLRGRKWLERASEKLEACRKEN